MFENASRKKFRFQTKRGMLSTEDLWDIPLIELDAVARALTHLKADVEISFISPERHNNDELNQKLQIVVHIINTRMKEQDDRQQEAARLAERQRIMAVIDRKENQARESLSLEELREKLKS